MSLLHTDNLKPWKFGSQLTSQVLSPVAGELSGLRSSMRQFLPSQSETSSAICDYVFSSEGKLVRPALFFLACQLFGYSGRHLLPMGAVCEFIHTASLLHDDVVDNSTVRRGKPSANTIWGDEAAVLTGDLIYSRASEMMADTGKIEVVQVFARAIRQMSEGELLQLEQLFQYHACKEAYFEILEAKTAGLMGACCRVAAILAGRKIEEQESIESYGLSLGLAFQLVDDALDYLGDSLTLGKGVYADFKEGKLTLPILLLKEKASSQELKKLAALIEGEKVEEEAIADVVELVRHYATATETLELARQYTDRALAALSCLPSGPAREGLACLAESMLRRSN